MDYLNNYMDTPITTPVVTEPEVKTEKIYKVKVTHPSLRMRKAPNLQAEVVGFIRDKGYYTIVDEANGWGQLENGNWIMLSYTQVTN